MADRLDALACLIADRVGPLLVERVGESFDQRADRLLTATEAAQILDRRPDWVRAHADELVRDMLTDTEFTPLRDAIERALTAVPRPEAEDIEALAAIHLPNLKEPPL
jgi:hypothetical protein